MDHNFLDLIVPNPAQGYRGIYSVCSAHFEVLAAAICKAADDQTDLLVEATPNQVNQFGGYSGLTPMDFRRSVEALAVENGLAPERIIFGADHLGPYVWRNEPARQAMQKALALTQAFAAAGFKKLHLDAGMALGGDPSPRLDHATVVKRTIAMLRAAEAVNRAKGKTLRSPITYVIGAEAPVPGGGVEEGHDPVITSSKEISRFVELCRNELTAEGLADTWRRIIAVVVQPGVDFGDRRVVAYDTARASHLLGFVKTLPKHMTCEVHSTDYQSLQSLAGLVDDGFRILKVGPCLTHAYRRAVFALAEMEARLLSDRNAVRLSRIREILDEAMVANPRHWKSHYRGTAAQIAWLRQNSLRDRIRYYWALPRVEKALRQLMDNLPAEIPSDLLSQHWPDIIAPDQDRRPRRLIYSLIRKQLAPYGAACANGALQLMPK